MLMMILFLQVLVVRYTPSSNLVRIRMPILQIGPNWTWTSDPAVMSRLL